MDEWYNAPQAQINLSKYQQETEKFTKGHFFGFSSKMKSLSQEQ